MGLGDCFHKHRSGSLLSTSPFIETLPAPHTNLPLPPFPSEGSHPDPNYYFLDYPTWRFRSPPYLPPDKRAIVLRDDPYITELQEDTVCAWTRPSWGWVGFRTDYDTVTEAEWGKVKRRLWERYKFQSFQEPDKFRILWVEDREELGGASLNVVRRAFNMWLNTHSPSSDPSFDCYDQNFCLVADTEFLTSTLDDISHSPTLPEADPGIEHSTTTTSILILDKRSPRAPAEQVIEEEAEFWEAEGVQDHRGYKGFMRCSLDDVAFLWGRTGNEDPLETIYGFARRAGKRPGGVYTFLNC